MIVREATDYDVFHVCRNLRDEDRAEQFALRFDDSAEALAADLVRRRPIAIALSALCTDAGEPAVLVGVFLIAPTVALFHMASTPAIAAIGREGHRWGKRRFIPDVLAPNVARAESRILASHVHARRWVGACGFVEEGIARAFGKNGEDFVHIAWVKS